MLSLETMLDDPVDRHLQEGSVVGRPAVSGCCQVLLLGEQVLELQLGLRHHLLDVSGRRPSGDGVVVGVEGENEVPEVGGNLSCRKESFSPQAAACISSWTPPSWTWTAGSPPCLAAASSCGQSLNASWWGVWNLCATCLRWRQRERWPAHDASVGGKNCYKHLKVKTISRI